MVIPLPQSGAFSPVGPEWWNQLLFRASTIAKQNQDPLNEFSIEANGLEVFMKLRSLFLVSPGLPLTQCLGML